MKEKLRLIVEDNTTKKGKIFDYFIQFLILLSLAAFSIQTLPNLKDKTITVLEFFELICVILFSLEYILRIYVSKNPWKYIFSFYGIIDLLSILPFFISHSIDLRALRVFRVFRIFRALKLIRYNKALHRFHLAAKIVKEEVILFLIVTAIFIFLASAGIYYFENKAQPEVFTSIFHSAWWAVVTLTTVGYGDVYPTTTGGKMFTFLILMIGVGIVTIPAGLVATALSKAREIQAEEKREKKRIKSPRK
ncbi:ion transporter [Nonlabens sp.]|uniref:ion transporter n=1 Tax=Nonlabens sp. TaxID=1888209 RepID=UPI0032676DAA